MSICGLNRFGAQSKGALRRAACGLRVAVGMALWLVDKGSCRVMVTVMRRDPETLGIPNLEGFESKGSGPGPKGDP